MIRSKNHKFDIRHHLVMFAQRDGIRKAARQFGCSRNTVRKWLRRYKQQGLRGLDELPRRPKRIPHKTGPEIERLVVD
jgi:transposase-like protein